MIRFRRPGPEDALQCFQIESTAYEGDEAATLAKIAKLIEDRNLARDLNVLIEIASRDAADRPAALARIKTLIGYVKGQFMDAWTQEAFERSQTANGDDEKALALWRDWVAANKAKLRWDAQAGRYRLPQPR